MADDSLWERAQKGGTPLLDKLAGLSEDEWSELTHRLTKHYGREMEARGVVMVERAELDRLTAVRSVDPVASEVALAEAVRRVRRFIAEWPRSGGHPDNIYSLWVHAEDEPRTLHKDDLLLILAALTQP